MAQEIELHLKDKFLNSLDGKDKSISKIPRYNQFQEIKTVLLRETDSQDLFSSSKHVDQFLLRDKLYRLNNLLTECKMLSRKHGFNSPEELLTINRIRGDLKQIKKDLKDLLKDDPSNQNNNQRRNTGDSSSHDRDISRCTCTTARSVDATKVYGFEDEVLSMESLLLKQGSDVHRSVQGSSHCWQGWYRKDNALQTDVQQTRSEKGFPSKDLGVHGQTQR